MAEIKLNISKLKDVTSKINAAIEKNKLNPKAGWIEIESVSSQEMIMKICSFDYYLEVVFPIMCESYDSSSKIHVTLSADMFVPLISKLDDNTVVFIEKSNCLILKTDNSEYTIPIIKELGKVKCVDTIKFVDSYVSGYLSGADLSTISSINAKGLLDSLFTKDIQQYIYVDNTGAITFTENIYINDFSKPEETMFKFLLNASQSKIMKIFDKFDSVKIDVEIPKSYEAPYKVRLTAINDHTINMIIVCQSTKITSKFPSIRLRSLASSVSSTHVKLDKKKFEKALQRLMVFDKKWDITELAYSKISFSENGLRLVSIKNRNYEDLAYTESINSIQHDSIIRFADLLNQVKAAQGKEIDISYGESPAIVINSYGLKQLIPEVQVVGDM